MVCVVGVRFRRAGKVYYFDPDGLPIPVGAKVVVETARGVEYGEVAVGPKDVPDDDVVQPLKKVLRIGTEKDERIAEENRRKEKEAFAIAEKKIASHGLEMTLVDVEYTFDNSKVIFYFTADGRVDFRELVRDLASVFRTRIEMRQIGVRDEAKLLGGIGPCGRILCCTSFLGEFAPVSIRMAKDQNLSLNPSKISGLCGRLMCCLRYEQETYEAAKKDPTLAPGYVPPIIPDEEDEIVQLEDQPVPAPVTQQSEMELSARVARAPEAVEGKTKAAGRQPASSDHRSPDSEQGNERRGHAASSRTQRPKQRAERSERPAGPAKGEGRHPNAKQGAERRSGRPNRPHQAAANAPKGQSGEGALPQQNAQSRHRSHRGHRRRPADKVQQTDRSHDGQGGEPQG